MQPCGAAGISVIAVEKWSMYGTLSCLISLLSRSFCVSVVTCQRASPWEVLLGAGKVKKCGDLHGPAAGCIVREHMCFTPFAFRR